MAHGRHRDCPRTGTGPRVYQQSPGVRRGQICPGGVAKRLGRRLLACSEPTSLSVPSVPGSTTHAWLVELAPPLYRRAASGRRCANSASLRGIACLDCDLSAMPAHAARLCRRNRLWHRDSSCRRLGWVLAVRERGRSTASRDHCSMGVDMLSGTPSARRDIYHGNHLQSGPSFRMRLDGTSRAHLGPRRGWSGRARPGTGRGAPDEARRGKGIAPGRGASLTLCSDSPA